MSSHKFVHDDATPPIGERSGTLRLTAAVDDLTCAYNGDVTGVPVRVRGVDCAVEVRKTGGDATTKSYLGVFLVLPKALCQCRFNIRLLRNGGQALASHETTPHKFKASARLCDYRTVFAWEKLVDPKNGFLNNDGQFVVEIDIEPWEPTFAGDSTDWLHNHAINFEHRLYCDMKMGVKGEEATIDCNKMIVCHHSNVIRRAMDNAATEEASTGVFKIGHDVATYATVCLFVRAMYDAWDADSMDEHAVDLMHMAHCYESDRVAKMALMALKRLLTMDTFWQTLQVATLLEHDELVNECAKVGAIDCLIDIRAQFANGRTGCMWQLYNQEEGQAVLNDPDNHANDQLTLAMAKMHTQ